MLTNLHWEGQEIPNLELNMFSSEPTPSVWVMTFELWPITYTCETIKLFSLQRLSEINVILKPVLCINNGRPYSGLETKKTGSHPPLNLQDQRHRNHPGIGVESSEPLQFKWKECAIGFPGSRRFGNFPVRNTQGIRVENLMTFPKLDDGCLANAPVSVK